MTTVHSEREAKFEGTGRFDPQGLRRLPAVAEVREAAPEELDAIYYDTADLRLLAHGVTLRRRRGGHDEGWHVKLPADAPGGPSGRTEVHAPLQAGGPGAVPDELFRRVAAYARGRDLAPVAHLRTHRRRHLLLDESESCLAELAQDLVAAQTLEPPRPAGARDGSGAPANGGGRQDGTRTRITQWSEIEVELEDGDPALLRAAADRLEAAGWHRSPSAHKLDHALADEFPAVRARERSRREEPRAGSAGEAVVNRIGAQVAELLAADAAARGDEDDGVHRMRSAARRLRSALRAHRRVLDRRRTDPVVRELRWLTRLLADARDHEVLADKLPEQAARLRRAASDPALRSALDGLPGRLREQERARHDTAWRAAVAALDSGRYFALLDALDELLADPPLRRAARKPAAEVLSKAAERDRKRLTGRLAAAEAAPDGPEREQALHAVRKAARRARHTAETAAPYGGKRARRLRTHTKALHKLLGDHQDAVIARQALLSLAADSHRAGADTFGDGLLYAAQQQSAQAIRAALPAVARKATARRLTRLG